jgi:hypothetical protein
MRCSSCQGAGRVAYEEDGRIVTDACYHCGTTGQVDEETDWHDRLGRVANTLAYQTEREYRRAVEEDPHGDGYDLLAAENMLSVSDYFQLRVWDRADVYLQQLEQMPFSDRELLVHWNEQEPQPPTRYAPQVIAHVSARTVPIPANLCGEGADDIPF